MRGRSIGCGLPGPRGEGGSNGSVTAWETPPCPFREGTVPKQEQRIADGGKRQAGEGGPWGRRLACRGTGRRDACPTGRRVSAAAAGRGRRRSGRPAVRASC